MNTSFKANKVISKKIKQTRAMFPSCLTFTLGKVTSELGRNINGKLGIKTMSYDRDAV